MSIVRQILDKEYWEATRKFLKNSYDINNVWKEVIKRFEERINDFYFDPIDRIKDPNKLKGEGFTILTIQCALIEMFAAFKFGMIHNHRKHGAKPDFEYRKADDCFIPFLQSEFIFENHFFEFDPKHENKLPNTPYNANEFYNKVRCGLMHEARTKGSWVINAKKKYTGSEAIFITEDKSTGRLSIDRNILNKQLRKYFQDYLKELSAKTVEGNHLRRLFARKLDHLYDMPQDPKNYDWWEDK